MRKIHIGILLFPGFELMDIAGPRSALGEVRDLGERLYEVFTLSTSRDPLQSACGLTVVADHSIHGPCPRFDTLLVPGGIGALRLDQDLALTSWLTRQAKRCRRLAAAGDGVFALASAGLLGQRCVTSHWQGAPRLAATFPALRVCAEALRLKDGPVYTCAGASAAVDLALLLIEEDFGRQMALRVARDLLVYLHRPSGQAQFSPLLDRHVPGDSHVQAIREYVLSHLQRPHSLASLAERVHMSPRNLTRLFSKQTGITPMAFVVDARIDAARQLLESTELPIAAVATRCGVDSADHLRRLFGKRLGLSPLEYRQRFEAVHTPAPCHTTASLEEPEPCR